MLKIASKAKSKAPVKKSNPSMLPFLVLGALVVGTGLFLTQLQYEQQTKSNAAGGDCTVSAADMQTKPQETEFLKLLNDYRATKGAGPLVISQSLKKPAQWYANQEAAQGYHSGTHNDLLGRSPIQRFADCGVPFVNGSEAENKLSDAASPAEALQTWQSDAPHDHNLTDPQSKYIGIGIQGNVWVTDFFSDKPEGDNSNSSSSSSNSSETAVPSPQCMGSCTTTPTASVSAAPAASSSAFQNTGNTSNTNILNLLLQLFASFFKLLSY